MDSFFLSKWEEWRWGLDLVSLQQQTCYWFPSILSGPERYNIMGNRFPGHPGDGSAINHSKLNILSDVSLFVWL